MFLLVRITSSFNIKLVIKYERIVQNIKIKIISRTDEVYNAKETPS